jgi:hypothetical protein
VLRKAREGTVGEEENVDDVLVESSEGDDMRREELGEEKRPREVWVRS